MITVKKEKSRSMCNACLDGIDGLDLMRMKDNRPKKETYHISLSYALTPNGGNMQITGIRLCKKCLKELGTRIKLALG